MRSGAVSAGAAAPALVSNSHLCHLPEVNEQLVRSGPSMFHVKPGGDSVPCSIERHAGWASRRGDKRAEDSGHRMEIDAQSSIRQRDYVPVDASSPATWQSGSAMAPSVVTAMPVDWDAVRMPSFDQGSTVCVKRFLPSLGGNRPAAMAPFAWWPSGPRVRYATIRLCRCEAGEAAHYGAAVAWRRRKLAAATDEPRSDCYTGCQSLRGHVPGASESAILRRRCVVWPRG